MKSPDFSIGEIEIVTVVRERNFKNSFRDGRKKHGFLLTESGSIFHRFAENDKSVTAKAGDLVFIPKGCSYSSVYLEDETQIKIVQFDLESGSLPSYLQEPSLLSVPGADGKIRAFFDAGKYRFSGNALYYLTCLYDLFLAIDESKFHLPSKYRKLSPALDEISRQCEQNEKISYYADLCGMSEVNFRRSFREYTGQTPIEYRNQLRLKMAQGMLKSGEYNVSETAERCGFSNLSFFSRLYKKTYKTTPKKNS